MKVDDCLKDINRPMGLDSYIFIKPRTTEAKIVARLKDEDYSEVAYFRKNYTIHEKLASYSQGMEDNCVDIELTKENLKEILKWIDNLKEEEVNERDKDDKSWLTYKWKEMKEELKEVIIKLLKEVNFKHEKVVYYAWY